MFFRLPNWKYLHYDFEDRWQRLNIRQWINDNPRIVTGVTVVSMFIFLVIVIANLLPEKAPKIQEYKKIWFYDLNTGELFITEGDKLPPIKAPSGALPDGEPAGVRAYVFSYSKEPNDSNRFIGYLEKLTPKGKEYASAFQKSRDNVTKELIRQFSKNRLIRRVKDKQWVPGDSTEAQAILEEIFLLNKNGEHPRYYPPK